jgi:vitamin B12 transporter
MNRTQISLICAGCLTATAGLAQQQSSTNSAQSEQDIETITVVSGLFKQPIDELSANVAVLDQDDLEARYQISLSDTIRSIASVSVSNSGGPGKVTTVRVRGEESFRTRLYIDGLELTDPTAPQVTPIFDDLLQQDIARVELLKGPQGLLYGADAGGVLSVFTQTAKEGVSGNVAAEFASDSLQRLSASLNMGNTASHLLLSVSDFETDGFNAQSTDTSGEVDPYENTTVHVKAGHQINEQFAVNLVLRNTEGETQYDGCFDNATFAQINNCMTESEQTSGRLSLEYVAQNSEHQLGYSKTEVTRDFINNGLFGFGNDGEVSRLDYAGRMDLGANQVTFGFDIREEEDNNASTSRDNKGYFVEWLNYDVEALNFNLGVRFDDNETFGNFTSWRTGINYHMPLEGGSSLRLKSTYGTGFRAPSLFEQSYNDGPFAFGDAAGLQLLEETSEGFDIGFVHEFGRNAWWSLTWFTQTIENEILFDNAGFQGYLQSSGESQSDGVEIEAESQFSNNQKLWFNYTLMDTEDEAGNQRLRRPEHMINAGYQQAFHSEKIHWSIYAHMERGAVDIGNVELDDYVVWHTNLNWQVQENFQVSTYINNLFDKNYVEVVGFNSAERQLGIKLALTY